MDPRKEARPPNTTSTAPGEEAGVVPEVPTDCLYYLVSRATLVATSILRAELAAAAGPRVKPAYLGALMSLWNEEGLRAVELARRAGLEPSTTTGLLDRMEADGLIERRPDPTDRRALTIHLTAQGRALREPVLGVVARMLARATRGISPQRLDDAREVLRRFLENMQAEKQEAR